MKPTVFHSPPHAEVTERGLVFDNLPVAQTDQRGMQTKKRRACFFKRKANPLVEVFGHKIVRTAIWREDI